jgi:hypothetical protein
MGSSDSSVAGAQIEVCSTVVGTRGSDLAIRVTSPLWRASKPRSAMTKTEVLALAAVGANRLRGARRADDKRQFRLGRGELSIEAETQSVAVELALPGRTHLSQCDRCRKSN